jgi:SAM-dependent methyltransferase
MNSEPDRAARALSFGAAADDYDRHRPGYPREAVAWATPTDPGRIVDLGAGTGILTRTLLALGHDAVPVEPDEAMRARLIRSTPGVTTLAGIAEAIPLQDASADGVVAGQAYHWFDPDRAHPEIARVLRPGGVFAPIWNRRDESVPWVAALTAIADDARGGPSGFHEDTPKIATLGLHFGPVELAVFRHASTHTADSLVAMMATRSYALTSTAARRAEILAAVRDLVGGHPDLAGQESFELPYVTVVYRAFRN